MLNKYQINKSFLIDIIDGKYSFFNGEKSQHISLNESASLIINAIQLGLSLDQLKKKFLKLYDVSDKQLEKDINNCLDDLVKNEILIKK